MCTLCALLFVFNSRGVQHAAADAEEEAPPQPSAAQISARLADSEPIFLDLLPLTLEEIFIYELGGTEHEVKSIVL